MKRFMILLLIASLVYSMSYNSLTNELKRTLPFIFIGNLIGLIIGVLQLYSAKITASTYSEVNAKNEIKTVFINIILVVATLALLSSYTTIMNIFVGGDVFTKVETILNSIIDNIFDAQIFISPLYICQQALSTFYVGGGITIPIPKAPIGITLNSNISNFIKYSLTSNWLSIILNVLSTNAGIYGISKFLLFFLPFIGATLFLPLGFFLRGLSFTRRIGSTMVSIGIVILFIFPWITYFFAYITKGIVSSRTNELISNADVKKEIINEVAKYNLITYTITTFKSVGTGIRIMRFSEPLIEKRLPYGIGYILASILRAVSVISWYVLSSPWLALKPSSLTSLQTLINMYFPLAEYTAIVSITSLFYTVGLVLSILGGIRSISLILGGEYFLYGVQSYV